MNKFDNNRTNCLPEFLAIFSNEGEYKVKVKILKYEISDASIADQVMDAHEVQKLIDPDTGMFFTRMYFDGYLFAVEKYEINLVNKWIKLTISPAALLIK